MGESTCLAHPFSYASGVSNEAKQIQGNPMHALGESVSFGRYMSEPLAWEKWSSFSHNRYVEEAERYAQPGSVAQKKAFFEAHYKRIAAKKAAALLEQANAANNTAPEQKCDTQVFDFTAPQQAVGVQPATNSASNSSARRDALECDQVTKAAADLLTDRNVQIDNPTKDESSNQLVNHSMVSVLEIDGSPQMETPLLERSLNSNQDAPPSVTNKKGVVSFFKSSAQRRASRVPSSPPKPAAPSHALKENNVTPITTISTTDTTVDKKRSIPQSLRALLNITPFREPDKISTPAKRRNERSRIAPSSSSSSSKAPKDCAISLKTPTVACANGVPKQHPSATPTSENRRSRTPADPTAAVSKTTGPKWHILSTVYSKSLSACRNKLQSPTLSTPFKLKTEERAARRKQKLEEKFNAKEAQKEQPQTKIEEKAESERRKLRKNLCFKARPLPDFYKERKTSKNQTKKAPSKHLQSPRLGRKPSSSMQSINSVHRQMPSTNDSGVKHVLKKNTRIITHSLNSQPKAMTHENTSPNILEEIACEIWFPSELLQHVLVLMVSLSSSILLLSRHENIVKFLWPVP